MVVLVSSLAVNAVTNTLFASSQTNATFSSVPRLPMKPMSTVGAPVWPAANNSKGSSTTTLTVSMVVVLPLTVKLPVIVRSLP